METLTPDSYALSAPTSPNSGPWMTVRHPASAGRKPNSEMAFFHHEPVLILHEILKSVMPSTVADFKGYC
ncbi:hypothetical protein JW979_03320 [bacterium]|nr:hypothetical protein [candidate division CSSED10-310 bacterium]